MITVEVLVKAPMEKAWDCFTNPAHITKWYFASDDWHAPFAENDLKVGGKFKTTMSAKDGSAGFDFEGIYSEVKKHQLIAYGLADGRQVRVVFAVNGGEVIVTESFDPESENSHELQKGGWQAILDNFKKYTELN